MIIFGTNQQSQADAPPELMVRQPETFDADCKSQI